jgi:hypothetical protein
MKDKMWFAELSVCCGVSENQVIEAESKVTQGRLHYTGCYRKVVSSLSCPRCLKNYYVDDSFDGNWYRKG